MKPAMQVLSLLAALTVSISAAQAAEFSVKVDSQNGHFPNAQFANGMGCQGDNLSPHITWSGVPEGAKSLVVTMYDPDAPTGSGWWHWVVVNVPPTVTELPPGAGSTPGKLPAGAMTINNDASQPGYGGVCPPAGQTHRYVITVQALKVEKLELPPNATPALVGFMAWANGLSKASATVFGGR